MLIGLLLVTALVTDVPVVAPVAAPAGALRAAPGETAGSVGDSVRQFPRVDGSNLEGKRFALPGDFEAEYNVVFVAFRREQQADVDSWLPFVREQKLAERGIRVYELPTLNRSYRWMGGFIDGGMARGIPEKATREATITLYIDKAPFKQALAIGGEDRISALIVARDGRVLWRADGPFTSAAGAGLAAAIDALKARLAL